MAKAYPKTKIGARANASRKSLKGRPRTIGDKGREMSNTRTGSRGASITRTASSPNSNAIVSTTTDKAGRMDKQQKAAVKSRTKRKMKANIKASKPGMAKAAKKVATKAALKGAAKIATRFAGPVGAGLLAVDAISGANARAKREKAAMKKSGKKYPTGGGQMKRKK